MSRDADVLILGGGCAGLSLAVALAERAPQLRVRILEAREGYRRDRTWCFWDAEPHPFSAGVTHRWESWRVRAGGTEARQWGRRYSYQHLPADAFYAIATRAVGAAGHALCTGVQVQGIRERDGGCEVETDRGALSARWVFDSRPAGAEGAPPTLEQRFTGWHVRTERPCFDPSVVDLMDFQPSSEPGRTAFLYALPFSTTEALVEATFLDPPRLAQPDAEGLLRRDLAGRLGGAAYEVLYRESAALPMGGGQASGPSRGPVRAIGGRGGRIKASSGYAFLRIQRQSAALAAALGAGLEPPTRFESPVYGALDRIFLQALQQFPEHPPGYFLSLFQRLPAETTVRFLSETASTPEILRAMLALPKVEFLRAALAPRAWRAA